MHANAKWLSTYVRETEREREKEKERASKANTSQAAASSRDSKPQRHTPQKQQQAKQEQQSSVKRVYVCPRSLPHAHKRSALRSSLSDVPGGKIQSPDGEILESVRGTSIKYNVTKRVM